MVADLGPAEQFPEGSVRRARAGQRALVVVHRAGRLHALRDQCPHQGAPLVEWSRAGRLYRAPGVGAAAVQRVRGCAPVSLAWVGVSA